MPLNTWLLYVAAVFVLCVTPGPAVLMSVTNGVNHGVKQAFFSALGVITAVMIIMAGSALGVGAAMAASEVLFNAIKWFGVAYLFYIGVMTLRSTTSSFELPAESAVGATVQKATSKVSQTSFLSLYTKGFLVGISNPKALLFFTAFFPQFLNPALPQLLQFAILGSTFVFFELSGLMFYATFASRLAPWLRTEGRAKAFNRVSGVTFIGASVLLATVKRAGEKA